MALVSCVALAEQQQRRFVLPSRWLILLGARMSTIEWWSILRPPDAPPITLLLSVFDPAWNHHSCSCPPQSLDAESDLISNSIFCAITKLPLNMEVNEWPILTCLLIETIHNCVRLKVEGLILATTCMLWATRSAEVSGQISEWTKEKDLLFATNLVKNFTENPQYYLHLSGGLGYLYSFTCVLSIIGALMLNRWLVIPFVIMELARLLVLTCSVVTLLLLVKRNSLDLGILMGGSIGGGFFLLFLFYLWSCPLSLCQALNELEDEKTTKKRRNEPVIHSDMQSLKLTDVNLSKPTTANVLWNPSMWDPDPYTDRAVRSFYIE